MEKPASKMCTRNSFVQVFLYSFLSTSFVIFRFESVSAQNTPSIACPNIFQYMNYGNNYIGKITLNNLPTSTIKVEVEFSQRESINSNYNGQLSLFQDLSTTQNNLENNQPVSYRVDFPVSHVLPKLTRIAINERTICSDNGLPPPSTTFKLYHTFYPSVTTSNHYTTIERGHDDLGSPNTWTYRYTSSPSNQDISSIFSEFGNGNDFLSSFFTPRPPGQPSLSLPPRVDTLIPSPPSPVVTPRPTRPPPAPTPRPTQPPPTPKPASTECGVEGEGLTPFIVGGTDFYRGKFPWLTAIYLRTVADLRFTCGGSLISPRTVITAAHCFLDTSITADRILVLLGRHNLFATEEGAEQRDVQKLIKHPEFNVSTLSDADVAILQLRSPVGFTQYIRPICLWTQPSQLSYIEGQKGYVAGWGADNQGTEVSQVPKMAEARIVSESECLRSSEVFRQLTSTRTICAGNRDGTGPCIGDSGGGLMINVYGAWTLRGIISTGQRVLGNCKLSEYTVFCDIAKFMSWVRQNMIS